MNKLIILVFFIVLITLIAGCDDLDVSKLSDEDLERISEKAVVCDKPYIRIGMECCLDQNDNKICDRDERELTPEEKEKEEKSVETTKIQTKQQSGKIIKIFEGDEIRSFDIWEDKIVFHAVTEDNGRYTGAIYLYDISTNEQKRITYDSSSKRTPLIYNDLIFWNDERFVDNNIFMYNLSSGEEKSLFKRLWVFDNFEDMLFVLDGFSGRWHLKFLDENKNIELPVEFKDMDYYNIYDNKIMLTKSHGSISTVDYVIPLRNILYYDFLTNKFVQVTNNTLDEKTPNIYKNKIVWSDNRNGKFNYDVYLYDLDTKQETQITSRQDTNELYPSIYGDYIVYQQLGDERSIHLYNIKTKEDKKIPEKAGLINENPLKIHDNKVVWCTCKDDWCADEELYLYII
tara:strand:+ start:1077 stop:2279 length:1203 start_codon:yes stop_codon:yes gene_type:complete